MKKFFLLLSITIVSCQPKDDPQLMKDVNEIFAKQKGIFAVAFKNLQTGETLFIHEHEIFHAASTMKTPVMIEVFNQVHQGKFALNDSLILKNEFKSIVDSSAFALSSADDSEQELYKHLGSKRTVDQLVYDMIISSSNLATNMIIELVDAKEVTETLKSLGIYNTKVLRGVEDSKAYEKGMNNVTTAYDLMVLFEGIAQRQFITAAFCERMENILLDQKFNEIIPALLPADVKVAHKTGNITGVRHDSGIVILPDGNKYVLVLLSKELEDEDAGINAMAEVSRKIYEHVAAESHN